MKVCRAQFFSGQYLSAELRYHSYTLTNPNDLACWEATQSQQFDEGGLGAVDSLPEGMAARASRATRGYSGACENARAVSGWA